MNKLIDWSAVINIRDQGILAIRVDSQYMYHPIENGFLIEESLNLRVETNFNRKMFLEKLKSHGF